MSVTVSKTLQNLDSKVRIDVESMARIEISDIELLLQRAASESDSRLVKIFYESAIHKTSTVFQLALKACDYLLKPELSKRLKSDFPKNSPTGLGALAKARGYLFHDGVSLIEMRAIFPFAIVEGRGFVGLRVEPGGTLKVRGHPPIGGKEVAFAFTSEGLFRVESPGSGSETWVPADTMPCAVGVKSSQVHEQVALALEQLKAIWAELAAVGRSGDGAHPWSYLNEGGQIALFHKGAEGHHTQYVLPASTPLYVTGLLVIDPPDEIPIV